jgi:hypothetical protein
MAMEGSCAGLAHDELEWDFGVAKVGGGAVAQLVQVKSGVGVEPDAGAAGAPGPQSPKSFPRKVDSRAYSANLPQADLPLSPSERNVA